MKKSGMLMLNRATAGLSAVTFAALLSISAGAVTNELRGDLEVNGAATFYSSATVLVTDGNGPLWVSTAGAASPALFVNNSDFVSIGRTAPGVRLSVASTGSAGTDFVQYWRNSSGAIVSSMTADGVLSPRVTSCNFSKLPTGTVLFFTSTACPSGWQEFTPALGRYVVGIPSTATLRGTSGTAFTSDLESRPVGQHNHSTNNATHTHTSTPDSSTSYCAGAIVLCLNNRRTGQPGNTSNNNALNFSVLNSTGTSGISGTNAPYMQLHICRKN